MSAENDRRLVVRLQGVSKTYRSGAQDVHALADVDLEIAVGEFVACAGPSGSGKTTLLNLIGCLDRPTTGEIRLGGKPVAAETPAELADVRERSLGFVFQSFNLIPVLTAYENVEFPLLLRGDWLEERRRRAVTEMLGEVGLGALVHRRPTELSGGQQQRVAVARALVKEPALVLADEPTANLDSETGREILELMEEMNRRHGTTFLFSTHDPMVMEHAHRLVRLKDGRVVSDEGTPCS